MWYEQSWINAGDWFSDSWFASGGGGGGGTEPIWYDGDWFVSSAWFKQSWFADPSTFVAGGGTALIQISGVRIRVDVKISRDRGSGTSSAGAAVTVNFNKLFADIITLDVYPVSNTSQKIFRVINFVDAPDPTSFNVEFYNEAGIRLALDFGWVAEGILKIA